MKKLVAIAGPPERWMPLCRDHRQMANFICVSPVRAETIDSADFSFFLVELFSGQFDILVATCPTVIDSMVELAKGRKMLDRLRDAIGRIKLVVIGERTAFCAEQYGFKVTSAAPEATTDSLVAHINAQPERGRLVLLRSDHGSMKMVTDLESSGWKVDEVEVYSIIMNDSEEMEDLLDRLEDGSVDALVFPTPAHAQAFLLQMEDRNGKDDAIALLEGLTVAAIGRETREALEDYGVKVDLVPDRAGPEELLRQLMTRLEDL